MSLIYKMFNSSTGRDEYHIGWVQEVPSGTVNGINADFTLSGTPVSANSTFVYLDGYICENTTWSLATNVVSFVTPPSPGQMPYVVYFK